MNVCLGGTVLHISTTTQFSKPARRVSSYTVPAIRERASESQVHRVGVDIH